MPTLEELFQRADRAGVSRDLITKDGHFNYGGMETSPLLVRELYPELHWEYATPGGPSPNQNINVVGAQGNTWQGGTMQDPQAPPLDSLISGLSQMSSGGQAQAGPGPASPANT